MRNDFSRVAAITVALSLGYSAAIAAPVVLESPDGSIKLDGDLKSVSPTHYVISTTLGDMKVERTRVECFGAGCPRVEVTGADLVVRGSDTIGEELMPLLLTGYAAALEAEVTGKNEIAPDTIALDVTGEDGFGEKIMTAHVQAAGSSTGFKALIAGQTDIAMSSRPARQAEIAAIFKQGRGDLVSLDQEYIIAVDSILTVVSPDNPIDAISMQQLAAIYAGQIRNWSELGGPDLPITVYTRPESSGTRGVFENAVLAPSGLEMAPSVVVLGSNGEIANSVTNDPGAIGYVGFAYKNGAKSLDLISTCGIRMSASAFSAKTEEYPLQRRLRLFTDNGRMSSEQRGLLDFATSGQADPFVQKAGFIDLAVLADDSPLDKIALANQAFRTKDFRAENMTRFMFETLEEAKRLSTTFRFFSGSAQLDNKSQRDLSRMVDFLKQPGNAGREIIVAGFTDSVGSFDLNARLSERRAATVLAALRNEARRQGVAAPNMRSVGLSELAPVGCNETDLGRYRNRRVEIWLR